MSKVKSDISMSLDGYVAGPHPTKDEPLGAGGEHLHDWFVRLRYFHEMTGQAGGDEDVSDGIVREAGANTGAEIMGRGKFELPDSGPWGADPWRGWWGDNPPFHKPVYVLTHYDREPLTLSDTTFTFVTDGIASALRQAQSVAGEKDVFIGGGASVINQFLAAGLLDELELHVVPLVLGGGSRLFDGVGREVHLEPMRTVEAPGVTHLKYRVVKDEGASEQ